MTNLFPIRMQKLIITEIELENIREQKFSQDKFPRNWFSRFCSLIVKLNFAKINEIGSIVKALFLFLMYVTVTVKQLFNMDKKWNKIMIVSHNCLCMFVHVQESNLVENNLIFHWEEMYILHELFRNHFPQWSLKSVHCKNKF